jgi:RNA polymerase sigma-70 factor (ECF subfamily)
VREEKPRFEASRRQRDELAARFFEAVGDGDFDRLVELLAADVVVYGDGGGVVPSWPRPIVGRDRVARLMRGVGQKAGALGVTMKQTEINGQPGALWYDGQGRLASVMTVEIADGVVQTVRSIVNPEKLGHLGRPLGDFRKLLRESEGVGVEAEAPYGEPGATGGDA